MTIKELKARLEELSPEFDNTQILVEHPMKLTKDYREQEPATFGGIEDGYLILRPLSNVNALILMEAKMEAGTYEQSDWKERDE